MNVLLRLIICISLIIAGNADADEIVVAGGGTATTSVFLPLKEHFENSTGDKLVITYNSPAKGVIALVKGDADILASAKPLPDILKEAALQKVDIYPSSFVANRFGINETVIVLNKNIQLKTLSKSQLEDIFTGYVTNWYDVGGDDAPITVVWEKGFSGQNQFFTRDILEGESVTTKAILANSSQEIRDIVSITPNAIGIVPKGVDCSALHLPETPKLTAAIFLISKGEPSVKVKRFLEFFKNALTPLDSSSEGF